MIGPRYTPAQIAAVFSPDSKGKKAPKKATGTKPSTEPAPDGGPPILGILRALGMTVAPAKDLDDGTGFRTTCPWASSHTDAVNDESGFLTIWPDGSPRHWMDRHSHCAERGLPDLIKLALERGIEVPILGNRTLDDLTSQARSKTGRPVILVCPPEVEVADAAREALATVDGVYIRRGRLAHVHRHGGEDGKRTIPAGSVGIRDAGPAWIRERMSEAADFERATKTKDGFARVASMVPDWLGGMILEAPGPGFRELRAVVTVPVMLPDGSILAKHGELRDGVLYLGPDHLPTVPEHPTEHAARVAWESLRRVWQDFPWALNPCKEAHEAAVLAALLTIVGRYAFAGPAPFVLWEANSQASGKGLAAQTVAIIATGGGAPVMACPREETELMKSILPVLMDATRVQVMDEVHPGFGGRGWNALITSTDYRGRLLGASALVELPNDTVWICTGNNVGLAPDTTRRCLPIRLEPMEEHPEDRDGFKIPDLLAYVRRHQAELLRDALTILRAFHVAGRPVSRLKPWGSFEGWSALIRDAVFWCTKVNPDCRQALASVADMGRIVHADLVAELYAAFGSNPFTTGTVIEKAAIRPDLRTALESACPSKDGKLHAVSIGKRFASFRRRPVAGRLLDQVQQNDRNGGVQWCIRALDAMPLHPIASDGWEAIS